MCNTWRNRIELGRTAASAQCMMADAAWIHGACIASHCRVSLQSPWPAGQGFSCCGICGVARFAGCAQWLAITVEGSGDRQRRCRWVITAVVESPGADSADPCACRSTARRESDAVRGGRGATVAPGMYPGSAPAVVVAVLVSGPKSMRTPCGGSGIWADRAAGVGPAGVSQNFSHKSLSLSAM
jgi:hypothetical protein